MNVFVPLAPRTLRDAHYVVQRGDTVDRIAGMLSGSPNRWPELVGANLHKRLIGTFGQPWMSFAELSEGEKLLVPGTFSQGSLADAPLVLFPSSGTTLPALTWMSGLPSASDIASAWNKVGDDALPYIQGGGGGWPAAVPVTTAANVVSAWLPYIANTVTLPTANWWQNPINVLSNAAITTLIPPDDIEGLRNLGQLMLSAAGWVLKSTGTVDPKTIPWDRIPWTTFPWQAFQQQLGWISTVARTWQDTGPAGPKTTPNFLTTNWQSGQLNAIDWPAVSWSGPLGDWMKDPKANCIGSPAESAARLSEMAKYQAYWTDADTFFDCYCAKYPVSQCLESPQRPPKTPVKPGTVTPPPLEEEKKEEGSNTGLIVLGVGAVVIIGTAWALS